MTTYFKTCLFIGLCGMSMALQAQQAERVNTPAAYDLMKARDLWHLTPNAAGLQWDAPKRFSDVHAAYMTRGGDFKRPQEGQHVDNLDFNTEGALFVGGIYAYGRFNYQRNTKRDANFNASILDPFRGMPYYVADTNPSDWHIQTYDMAFRVATPRFYDKWTLGLEASYVAKTGAKQRDPRTHNFFYTMRMRPALTFSPNERHHIGAHFDYFSLKEEGAIQQVNVYVDQTSYNMYGLGMSVEVIDNGRHSNYEGNNVGGGLQYNYQGTYAHWILSADYNYKVEKLIDGLSRPRDEGGVKDRRANITLRMKTDTKRMFAHFLTASVSSNHIEGIEYITKYDNTPAQNGYVTLLSDVRLRYKTHEAFLQYDWVKTMGEEYSWKVGMDWRYTDMEHLYLTPRSEKSARYWSAGLNGAKNIAFQGPLLPRLLLKAAYRYQRNISGKYDYKGNHADYPVVKDFETADTRYLNSNFSIVYLSATYSRKYKSDKAANLYLRADALWQYADKKESGHRREWTLTLGSKF